MITTCETCRKPFTARRGSARFCSDRCRVAAYRARAAVTGATPRGATNKAVKAPPRSLVPAVTLRVPPGVVPDAVYRGMFRIRLPGGGLSAMVNLTRARDALRTQWARSERKTQFPELSSPLRAAVSTDARALSEQHNAREGS